MNEEEQTLIESTFGDDLEKMDAGSFKVTLSHKPALIRVICTHALDRHVFILSTELTSLESREWKNEAERVGNEYFRANCKESTPIFGSLLFLQEYVVMNPPPQPPAPISSFPLPSAESPITPENQIVSRMLFRSHHLLSTQKRKSILSWCAELSLWGISKIGYPGIIIVEGPKSNVEEFERKVKGLNWLALSTRWTEDDGSGQERLGTVVRGRVEGRLKVVELESLAEVGRIMREAGLEKMFGSVFRIG